jgi:hypothetical protein
MKDSVHESPWKVIALEALKKLKEKAVVPKAPVTEPISATTLRCIEKSIVSMRAGKRSPPANLKELAAMTFPDRPPVSYPVAPALPCRVYVLEEGSFGQHTGRTIAVFTNLTLMGTWVKENYPRFVREQVEHKASNERFWEHVSSRTWLRHTAGVIVPVIQ